MGQKIKKFKKIRLHREGTDQLVTGAIALVAIAAILWTTLDNKIPFWAFVVVFGTVYGIVLNFYRCPIRYLNVEDTSKLVVAPADGKIVVIEEVENAPYFGDRRHLHEPLECSCQLVPGRRQGEIREACRRQLPQGMAA